MLQEDRSVTWSEDPMLLQVMSSFCTAGMVFSCYQARTSDKALHQLSALSAMPPPGEFATMIRELLLVHNILQPGSDCSSYQSRGHGLAMSWTPFFVYLHQLAATESWS